jgi:hypothetical protein
MPTYYSKEIVDEVQRLLITPPSVQPINTTWKMIMQVFKREQILKPKRLVNVKDIFPHPKNRGGMMLNGFNAQANASKVQRVGANRDELHGAVCLEMNPFPATKKCQIDANLELVEKSKGLIAKPFGSESLLSLGTGHMVAFCRAALQQIRACFKNLENEQGQISLEILFRDLEFKIMIQEGWTFEVLPWQVEVTWPLLPEFAQRALNASNSVSSDATEWEVAITIGETYSNMDEPNWDLAVDSAAAGAPQCLPYIQSIRKLVSDYGGGPSFPIILEQEEYYKTLGENKRLGEEFPNAIVDVKLDEFNPRVHVRHALIALNLTSTKIVDGVVKFILKSNVSALASKDKKSMVDKADDELRTGRAFLYLLRGKNRIAATQYIELMGLFRVRYGGFLTKMGAQTFEGKVYQSEAEIVALFVQDVSKAIKDHDQPGGGSVNVPDNLKYGLLVTPNAEPTSLVTSVALNAPLTVDEVSSLGYAASQKGFNVGIIVFEKKVGYKDGLYTITKIDETVELSELDAFKDQQMLLTVRVSFEAFMKGWQQHRGDVPTTIEGDWSARFAPNSFASKLEDVRCRLFMDLRAIALGNNDPPMSKLVKLCLKPTCLRAAVDSKKGEIIIYPVISSITQISKDKSVGAIAVATTLKNSNGGQVIFYIGAPPQPRDVSIEKWKETEMISPWKWLDESIDDDQVNMIMKEKKNQNGFMIPFIENKRGIETYERLYLKKNEKVKRKLEEATTEIVKPAGATAADGRGGKKTKGA